MASSTYDGQGWTNVVKSDPLDTELLNTIGKWVVQTRSAGYDANMLEHDGTGLHKAVSLFIPKTVTLTAGAYTVLAGDMGKTLVVNNSELATLTLPNATAYSGKYVSVLKTGAVTYPIVFVSAGGNINGLSTCSLIKATSQITFFSDGTNWFTDGAQLRTWTKVKSGDTTRGTNSFLIDSDLQFNTGTTNDVFFVDILTRHVGATTVKMKMGINGTSTFSMLGYISFYSAYFNAASNGIGLAAPGDSITTDAGAANYYQRTVVWVKNDSVASNTIGLYWTPTTSVNLTLKANSVMTITQLQ